MLGIIAQLVHRVNSRARKVSLIHMKEQVAVKSALLVTNAQILLCQSLNNVTLDVFVKHRQ